ncbi:hypothetical protein GRI97_08835 [Altererythrobacter xixiisoli]|uniref:Uncharacterized protein n=1 Tax=Croceibacterium xixiisoli TaxID=1476466 RepID=A0A6I4TT88_9SPHN|nr:hypothetical protein [Croceibacterium xixiisoli]MXO99092.1 hypothetical protein [Croceibacterium xixiisoli]
MIEFIPYLLILIGWNPAAPAETMLISRSLYPDKAHCLAEGDRQLAAGPQIQGLPTDAAFRYFCVAAPSGDEAEALFEQVK